MITCHFGQRCRADSEGDLGNGSWHRWGPAGSEEGEAPWVGRPGHLGE